MKNQLFGSKKKEKNIKKIDESKRVFGVPFNRDNNTIPEVVKSIVEYFDTSKEGVEIEGLFRISGQLSEVLRCKAEFDEGDSFN